MYQNNYTNIPEQYLELLRNGPNESTVIRGEGITHGGSCLNIWIKPNIMIGTDIEEPHEIWVRDGGKLVVPPTKITKDFGYKWIDAFNKVFSKFNFQPE